MTNNDLYLNLVEKFTLIHFINNFVNERDYLLQNIKNYINLDDSKITLDDEELSVLYKEFKDYHTNESKSIDLTTISYQILTKLENKIN